MKSARKSLQGKSLNPSSKYRRWLCRRSPPGTCWFIVTMFSSWLTCPQQVSCLFRQHSMEARNCSDFRLDEYPHIIVKHGDQETDQSFSIKEDNLYNHELFYFKCVAPYPIEWISEEPMSMSSSYSPSGAAKAVLSHLHIYRTFSDFLDHNSYRFVIQTRARYKKDVGFKQIHGTCRSIVKPTCLSSSIVSVDNEESGVAMRIFIDRFEQSRRWMLPTLSSAKDDVVTHPRRRDGIRLSNKEDDVDADGDDTRSNSTSLDCDYKIYYEDEDSSTGARFTFLCQQKDGVPAAIRFIHQCANAMTCLNLFRNSRLPSICAQPLVRNVTCVGCGRRSQLGISQGLIGCEGAGSEDQQVLGREKRLLFFFTSIPQGHLFPKLYFRMEDAQPSEMMRLSKIPRQVYLGEQLTVTCNVSNYYFAGGTRLALKYSNSETLMFLKTVPKHFDAVDHARSVIEATIPVTSVNLERVYCFAPVWNSFDWVNKSRIVSVREVISGDIIIAVSITVFLTALLVAMMFGLLWIKIGKKHGRVNLLTASEIEEFRRGSVSAEESKPVKTPRNSENSNHDMISGTTSSYDTIYEIKRDRLLLDETAVLGHGHFGVVLRGIVKDMKSEVRIDVAVKTLKTKVDVGSLKALLSELKILASVGKNSNVVNLVGACTKKMSKGEVYVAVEYCSNGNLQNFLRRHRPAFRNQLENDVLVIETPIRKLSTSSECIMTIDLIRWAWETAKGMEFLGSKKVIHGDLATRNILLTSEHVAKVSDFGLSRQLVDYYYVQKETGPMPWKWMALESLRDMKFSVQSDIWSFGVTLWELFTLAEIPYSGCSWSAEFVETLAAGHRLGKPKFATSEMYDLMRECWKPDPSSRPSFFAIRMFFEDILTQCTSQDYVQLNVSRSGTLTTDDEYQSLPLLQSPRIIIEEEGEDDVFE